jgi:hypothetical protein
MPRKHYTPPLYRFIVCALFHEAKVRGIPMTRLANDLVEAGLKDSLGWKQAQAQQEAMLMAEGVTEYQTRYPLQQSSITRLSSSSDWACFISSKDVDTCSHWAVNCGSRKTQGSRIFHSGRLQWKRLDCGVLTEQL